MTHSRDDEMQCYRNISGDSGVIAFAIGDGAITIQFRDGGCYLYSVASTGADDIATMQQLAREGKGLCTFISQFVRDRYERKLD